MEDSSIKHKNRKHEDIHGELRVMSLKVIGSLLKSSVFILMIGMIVTSLRLCPVEGDSLSESMMTPNEGDYLRYNLTVVDTFGISHMTTVNLTFDTVPFNITTAEGQFVFNETLAPDFVKATVEVGDWFVLVGDHAPEYEACFFINCTDRSGGGTYPFNSTYCLPYYFDFMIPTFAYVGAEVPFCGSQSGLIVEANNVVLYGNHYPVWVVEYPPGGTGSVRKYEATSGVLLWQNDSWGSPGYEEYALFELIEARIDDFVVVPEFPSLVILSIFMIATLVAVVIYRKTAKSDGLH